MADFVEVCKVGDLKPGECKTVETGDVSCALYNVDGTFYATDNTCPHRGGPLGEGELSGNQITCPWHGWTFDVTTGTSPMGPLTVKTFSCKVEGDSVLIAPG